MGEYMKYDNDYVILKDKYGENFSKLCRSLFPSILEKKGLLSSIICQLFEPNKYLYEDIIKNNAINDFQRFILSKVNIHLDYAPSNGLTPKELLDKAGYILYKCETYDDLNSFKRYYKDNEELCSFHSANRLERCDVFFAVKKNAEEILRKDFPHPLRQDAYGTSVISIQFTKDKQNVLSIKNRYNHNVDNPDATFSNNLDNIILGLTKSFEEYYSYNLEGNKQETFNMDQYVIASDNKYYKFNYEINGIRYCPNNVIIDVDNNPIKLDGAKVALVDYFIFDMQNKSVYLYDEYIFDSFQKGFTNIKNIKLYKDTGGRCLIVKFNDKDDVVISLDNENRMKRLFDSNLKYVSNGYLIHNRYLEEVMINNATEVGTDFLFSNLFLKDLHMSNVKKVASNFLFLNSSLQVLDAPLLETKGYDFLYSHPVYGEEIPKDDILNNFI